MRPIHVFSMYMERSLKHGTQVSSITCTVKPVDKDHPRDQQNVVRVRILSLLTG